MITKIKLKNVATYDNIGVEINSLNKVNFFFGYNGSGKSTIAKYLKNITLEGNDKYLSDFDYCTYEGYDKNKEEILVFNDQFIEDNFRLSNKQKGIFSLDEINTKIKKKIDENNKEDKCIQRNIEILEGRKTKLINEESRRSTNLLNICYEKRRIFQFMQDSIVGLLPHKKDAHLTKVKEYILDNREIKTFEILNSQYNQLYKTIILKVEDIQFEYYCQLNEDGNFLLNQIIIGAGDVNFSNLVDKLSNINWVQSGIQYLKNSSDKCPFCQQEINNQLISSEINNLFDENYKKGISAIEEFKHKYENDIESFLNHLKTLRTSFNPSNLIDKIIEEMDIVLTHNILTLDNKLRFPNQKYSLQELGQIKDLIDQLNNEILKNNELFEDLEKRKSDLYTDIWCYIANECKPIIQIEETWSNKKENLQHIIINRIIDEKARKEVLFREIKTLMSQTSNTKVAVDNINILLKSVGFTGFVINEVSEANNIKYYRLERNNTTDTSNKIFKSLSEGEKNFISFLYFYQLCLGTDNYEENKSKKKIIVIDDPVSSMDTQVLFMVSSLIIRLIKRKEAVDKKDQFNLEHINQLILLTHNIYFYKEVTYGRRPICTKKSFFKIIKNNNVTQVISSANTIVNDDYSYLWENIKNSKANISTDKSQNIVIANQMRRIVESYSNFINMKSDVWATINYDDTDPLYIIKSSFLSFINDESHSINPTDNLYYQRITDIEPMYLFDVFKSIFNVIGKDHYNHRMQEETEE